MSTGGKGGGIRHGDKEGERSFGSQLSDYLQKKEERYEIIQLPSIGPSFRAMEPDFLVSLVRDSIARKNLLFFQLSENRTPMLLDRIRHTDLSTDILEIPELKALAHVMDDFECGPWRPPEQPERKEDRSPWAL